MWGSPPEEKKSDFLIISAQRNMEYIFIFFANKGGISPLWCWVEGSWPPPPLPPWRKPCHLHPHFFFFSVLHPHFFFFSVRLLTITPSLRQGTNYWINLQGSHRPWNPWIKISVFKALKSLEFTSNILKSLEKFFFWFELIGKIYFGSFLSKSLQNS